MSAIDRQEHPIGFLQALAAIRRWYREQGLVVSSKLAKWLRNVVLGLFALGVCLFVFFPGSPPCSSQRALLPHPRTLHNLAAGDYGPTVCVSSYFHEVDGQHHPAFLTDGREKPTKVEKWATTRSDKTPWLELRWRGVHATKSVIIRHGGAYEDPWHTASDYSITCIKQSGKNVRLTVSGNRQAIAEHPLDCPDALGIRIDFSPMPNSEIMRVFEVEVWGV